MTRPLVPSLSALYASSAICETRLWTYGEPSTYTYASIIASYTPPASRSSPRVTFGGIVLGSARRNDLDPA